MPSYRSGVGKFHEPAALLPSSRHLLHHDLGAGHFTLGFFFQEQYFPRNPIFRGTILGRYLSEWVITHLIQGRKGQSNNGLGVDIRSNGVGITGGGGDHSGVGEVGSDWLAGTDHSGGVLHFDSLRDHSLTNHVHSLRSVSIARRRCRRQQIT